MTQTSYRVSIRNISDYSPFGVGLDGRTVSSNSYRYGFQGQEGDDEIKGEGNSVNYKYRMHDPRIGRFFAVDPLADEYPYYSQYAFSGNIVIHAVELEGLEPDIKFESPQSIHFIGGDPEHFDKDAYNEAFDNIVMPAASAIMMEFAIGELFIWATTSVKTYKATKTAASGKATQKVIKSEKVIEKSEQGIKKTISPKAAQLAKNKAVGAAHEAAVKTALVKALKPGEELLEQATYKLSNGQYARPDFTIVKNNKIVRIIDAKSGGAKLSKNQEFLQTNGGKLVGEKSGKYAGTSTKAKKIEIK